MNTNEAQATALATRWESLRATTPHLRTRDAAAQLGVSEAELVATMVGRDRTKPPADPRGSTAVRLDTDAASLLHALPDVGRCMALTRNEHAVSEVRGRYGGIELGAHAGQVVGEHIDLRVFLGHWQHAFAIDEPHPQNSGARRRSIHIFDGTGTAVHKIYLEPEGDARAWDAIVAARTATLPLVLEPAPPKRPERPDSEVEIEPLVAAWDAMTDTHEFFHLLVAHKVSRTQALRLAGTARARRVRADSMSTVLHDASETGEKIMIFVGNRGCIQVFSGDVGRIVRQGPWINVLDPGFNLHLREDKIASSWVVAKPTRSGVVRSLELFDADGETIALVFRKRDDRDCPEDPAWHALLGRLPEAS
jgi:putative hemin transport protein